MMTITASTGAACTIQTSSGSFEVFPAKVPKDTWALLSHPEEDLSNKKAVSWPGEYDFSGVTVRAVGQEAGKQVSYLCVSEGLRVAVIDAPVLEWTDAEIEKLGDVDILVIAADNAKKVTSVVEAVDPRIVVLFKVKDGDMAAVAKACGMSSVQTTGELKLKPSTLPQDSRQVVVLG